MSKVESDSTIATTGNSTSVIPRSQTPTAGLSEDEDDEAVVDADGQSPSAQGLLEVTGTLSKWTNYIHGWQDRFFVLKNGVLFYYRAATEVRLGCRGSICIQKASFVPHAYDDCRFDVHAGPDCCWYLRATSDPERKRWVQALELHRHSLSSVPGSASNGDSAYDVSVEGGGQLRRQGSLLSLASAASVSVTSTASFKRTRNLREKLAEMETYREILCKQVETLQSYFDACAEILRHPVHDSLALGGAMSADSDLVSPPDSDPSHEHPLPNASDLTLTLTTTAAPDDRALLTTDTNSTATTDSGSHSSVQGASFPSTSASAPSVQSTASTTSAASSSTTVTSSTAPKARFSLFSIFGGQSQPPATTTAASASTSVSTSSSSGSPTKSASALPLSTRLMSSLTSANRSTAPASAAVAGSAGGAAASAGGTGGGADAMQVSSPLLSNETQRELLAILRQHGAHALDFKGEAFTFKATTAGILASLAHCIELMQQREESWRKRVEKEVERRHKLEEAYRSLRARLLTASPAAAPNGSTPAGGCVAVRPGPGGCPDFEEGPHCLLGEDEFFDAVDAEIEKMEIEERKRIMRTASTNRPPEDAPPRDSFPHLLHSSHPIHADVCRAVDEHLRFSRLENTIWGGLADGAPSASDSSANVWQLFFEEGNIRMYRRELERDGRVIDPLKATHLVKGITGRELLKYFYELQYRMEWDFTLDLPPVLLEKAADDTMVIYQIYRRVWPAAQRDGVFWSHIRRCSDWAPPPSPPTTSDAPEPDHKRSGSSASSSPSQASVGSQGSGHSTGSHSRDNVWLVVNYSHNMDPKYFKSPAILPSGKNCIHLVINVCMMARTLVKGQPPEVEGPAPGVRREDIECHIQYTATIDPGGWAPASVLRTVYKREYPHFLKKFTEYVIEKTRGTPPNF